MAIEWKGVMPAVTTKFTDDDKLDFGAFEKNINAQLDAGVEGLVLGGTLGEASTLTGAEKEELVEKTLKIASGRVPIIINVAEQTHPRCRNGGTTCRGSGRSGPHAASRPCAIKQRTARRSLTLKRSPKARHCPS